MSSTVKAQLKELLPFLRDPNQQVRFAALQALTGHSTEGSPGRQVFLESNTQGDPPSSSTGVIADLKVLCRDSSEIAHEAFKMLVNLSDSPILSSQFAEQSFLAFLVSYIANPSAVMADLACMLLANATGFQPAAIALSQLTVPLLPLPSSPTPYYPPLSRCGSAVPQNPYPEGSPKSTSALAVLVDAFVRAAVVSVQETQDGGKTVVRGDPKRKSDLHFLAGVFTNVTGFSPGREFFVTPAATVPLATAPPFEYPLSKLKAFTEHSNNIRRKGVSATIRNCAFYTPGHKALLGSDQEHVWLVASAGPPAPGINILPAILLPLAGPEEFDLDDMETMPPELQLLPETKLREKDALIRLAHVDTLLLLGTTKRGRVYLRKHGVYPVIKVAHLAEDNEQVAEQMVRLVSLLKREEGPETEGDGEEYWVAPKGDSGDDDDSGDEITEVA